MVTCHMAGWAEVLLGQPQPPARAADSSAGRPLHCFCTFWTGTADGGCMLNLGAELEMKPSLCSQGKDCFSPGSMLQRENFSPAL